MSELHEPPLRVSVEAMRWHDGKWDLTGQAAAIEFHSTDMGDTNAGQLIRLLRATVNERLTVLVPMLMLGYHELDFEAPNPPTETDLHRLVMLADNIHEALLVLEQLAPAVYDDDEAEAAEEAKP